MIEQSLLTATKRFENWIKKEALPLWATAGINPSLNASYEQLHPNGTPDLNSNVRARVQARQIFVFACSHNLGWYDQGNEIANNMLKFVNQRVKHPSKKNGYTHLMNSKFEVIDDKQDLYDHAFFLLAIAWSAKNNKSAGHIEEAEALFVYLDKTFGSKHGGWLEGDYDYPHRRQNPHMHLFEAFLALYDASGKSCWLERADQIYDLFKNKFFDKQNGVLLEYFDDSWNPADDKKDTIVEPGHHMEWVWLLHVYSTINGSSRNVDVSNYMITLYNNAMAYGFCQKTGLLFDEANENGKVLKQSKRLWPITELIKANIAMAEHVKLVSENELTRNVEQITKYETEAARGIDLLFEFYIDDNNRGCYLDQVDPNGERIASFAKASSLYHLLVSAAEVSQYCGESSGIRK